MAKKKMTKETAATTDQPSFEESLAELETIVAELESGELGLEQALTRYEQGIGRLKQCHAQLSQATRQVELLSGVDAAGNPVTQPYDDEEHGTLAAKSEARSRRRTANGAAQKASSPKPPSAKPDVDDDRPLF